jgi:hypothetical protein
MVQADRVLKRSRLRRPPCELTSWRQQTSSVILSKSTCHVKRPTTPTPDLVSQGRPLGAFRPSAENVREGSGASSREVASLGWGLTREVDSERQTETSRRRTRVRSGFLARGGRDAIEISEMGARQPPWDPVRERPTSLPAQAPGPRPHRLIGKGRWGPSSLGSTCSWRLQGLAASTELPPLALAPYRALSASLTSPSTVRASIG